MKEVLAFIVFSGVLFQSCQSAKCHSELQEELLESFQELDKRLVDISVITINKQLWKERGEPSLLTTTDDFYRLTIDNLFGNFKIFQIEKSKNDYTLYVKEFDEVGGNYDRDTTIRNEEYVISENEWNELNSIFHNHCFWKMAIDDGRQGFDGTVWKIDARTNEPNNCTSRSYHVVGRWSPIDTVFISMCNAFIRLAEAK